jgi:hypothetical protein
LSADISSERLADFVARHSENDLRVLILFKLIKTRVISALQASHGRDMRRVDSKTLDQFCLDKAKKLAAIGKDPTEEDVRSLVALMVQ